MISDIGCPRTATPSAGYGRESEVDRLIPALALTLRARGPIESAAPASRCQGQAVRPASLIAPSRAGPGQDSHFNIEVAHRQHRVQEIFEPRTPAIARRRCTGDRGAATPPARAREASRNPSAMPQRRKGACQLASAGSRHQRDGDHEVKTKRQHPGRPTRATGCSKSR